MYAELRAHPLWILCSCITHLQARAGELGAGGDGAFVPSRNVEATADISPPTAAQVTEEAHGAVTRDEATATASNDSGVAMEEEGGAQEEGGGGEGGAIVPQRNAEAINTFEAPALVNDAFAQAVRARSEHLGEHETDTS